MAGRAVNATTAATGRRPALIATTAGRRHAAIARAGDLNVTTVAECATPVAIATARAGAAMIIAIPATGAGTMKTSAVNQRRLFPRRWPAPPRAGPAPG